MKKKIYVILLILVLIMCSPISVFAEELHFKKLSFNMKEYWYYVTKDNIDGNSSISEFGVTEEYMKNLFETQSIYCEGVYKYTDNKEEWLEVYLQIFELDLDQKVNFNKVSDSEILEFGESMFESVNADYVKIETISDNKYVVAKYNDSVALNSGVVNANILQYYTIQDNVGYSFKFQKINDFLIGNERVMNELLSDVKFE
ncbi:MAG: hypothetical protein IJG68_04010 [Bacilli bacterium]|nr:hypothetical protein [Bacilli bacterium]